MTKDFTGEKLPRNRYLFRIVRHQVPGGWYVRAIFAEIGAGTKPLNEAALYISDPDNAWSLEGFAWEKLEPNPLGGVYRAKVHDGWMILGTMRGEGKTDDGEKYHPRLGSLVFIPDAGHTWECKVINESDPKFYGGTS